MEKQKKLLRLLEFVLLCVALPTIIIIFRLAPILLLCLWIAAIYCWCIYYRNYFSNFKTLWKWGAVNWKNLKPILIRWLICSALILLFTYLYDVERFLFLPSQRPYFIPTLAVFYTLLSALPQEFIGTKKPRVLTRG